jgi:hypothetical protein
MGHSHKNNREIITLNDRFGPINRNTSSIFKIASRSAKFFFKRGDSLFKMVSADLPEFTPRCFEF